MAITRVGRGIQIRKVQPPYGGYYIHYSKPYAFGHAGPFETKAAAIEHAERRKADFYKESAGKNPAIEYGVVVHGSGALSKAGFATKQAAQQYVKQLRVRGLLLGRDHEIIKIDNERMSSERVNPRRLRFKTLAAAVKYAYSHGVKRFKVSKLRRR